MTEGLFGGKGQEEEEEEEEDEGRDAELPPFKRPVRAEDRKSKKQRRKAREMKEEVSEWLLSCSQSTSVTLLPKVSDSLLVVRAQVWLSS